MRESKKVKQVRKAYWKARSSQKAKELTPKLLENYILIKKEIKEKRKKKLAPKIEKKGVLNGK